MMRKAMAFASAAVLVLSLCFVGAVSMADDSMSTGYIRSTMESGTMVMGFGTATMDAASHMTVETETSGYTVLESYSSLHGELEVYEGIAINGADTMVVGEAMESPNGVYVATHAEASSGVLTIGSAFGVSFSDASVFGEAVK